MTYTRPPVARSTCWASDTACIDTARVRATRREHVQYHTYKSKRRLNLQNLENVHVHIRAQTPVRRFIHVNVFLPALKSSHTLPLPKKNVDRRRSRPNGVSYGTLPCFHEMCRRRGARLMCPSPSYAARVFHGDVFCAWEFHSSCSLTTLFCVPGTRYGAAWSCPTRRVQELLI